MDLRTLELTLIFLHLSFFFSPSYQKTSGRAFNNPTVYFLLFLLGQITITSFSLGIGACLAGHTFGLYAFAHLAAKTSITGLPAIIPVVAKGGLFAGAVTEAFIAFINFVFGGFVVPRLGPLGPFATSFFYCLTMVVENCTFSCGYMNPAVPFATHAFANKGASRTRDACVMHTCDARIHPL